MIETHLNLFDITVIAIMGLSCLFAFFRGLVREILSLVGWMGATIFTAYYFRPVAEKLADHFRDPHVAMAVAIGSLFIGALLAFFILNMLIVKTIKSGEGGGMLDNMLGLVFGAFRGAFIVSVAFFMLNIAFSEDNYPDWLKEAATRPYAEKGVMMLTRLAPETLQEVSELQKRSQQRMHGDGEETARHNDDNGGYNQRTTRQLDRLIESTEPSR
jgi:membrane protein required for colicin V production